MEEGERKVGNGYKWPLTGPLHPEDSRTILQHHKDIWDRNMKESHLIKVGRPLRTNKWHNQSPSTPIPSKGSITLLYRYMEKHHVPKVRQIPTNFSEGQLTITWPSASGASQKGQSDSSTQVHALTFHSEGIWLLPTRQQLHKYWTQSVLLQSFSTTPTPHLNKSPKPNHFSAFWFLDDLPIPFWNVCHFLLSFPGFAINQLQLPFLPCCTFVSATG